MTAGGALSRRRFLALAGAGSAGLVLASCRSTPSDPVAARDPAIAAAERRRRTRAGREHDIELRAGPTTIDIGGLTAATWAYGPAVPGPELRVRAGDLVRARFTNDLPEPTTIHWHGIAIRNDMDGVPGVTQEAVPPGGTFLYEFTPPDPGTFWFHPHFGLHLDRGLYAPLIVEDPAEPGRYDREYVVVLDDWIDGVGASPEQTLADLRAGRGGHAAHAGHGGGDDEPAMSGGDFLGGQHSGDVTYPIYVLNGRRPSAAPEFEARPGERLRLRIVNAASDTPFRVAVGGHRMTVTHTDGFPVEPVTVDALVIGMAERYDVVVTVTESGAIPLVAVAEAKGNEALGVIRSGPGTAPSPGVRPAELTRRVLRLSDLTAAPAVRLPRGRPDRLYDVVLGGGDEGYVWTINGEPHGHDGPPLRVQQGERVRLAFENRTVMFHPMHLHGHTFQVVRAGRAGARKDTAIVRPDEAFTVDFVTDNPGQWMLHCHNLYHQEAGMMTTVSYVTD
ncbi:MAG TPA: multicopper oxidase family protein [Acidimicrobiales bacterium]|nr:multicopper oxidase family protein [Acidimicrobiales bacterium]